MDSIGDTIKVIKGDVRVWRMAGHMTLEKKAPIQPKCRRGGFQKRFSLQ